MTTRRPTTPEERIVIKALQSGVTYPVASWDKRFARQLNPDAVSEKEVPQVWRLFLRYRRQISAVGKLELLAMAEKLAAPDFRKQQAQARERERLDAERKRYEDVMHNSDTNHNTMTL